MTGKGTVSVLGYDVFSGSREFFTDGLTGVVNTLNPHSYVMAKKDTLFSEALKRSDLLIPDGVGIKYAARVLSGTRIEKITGSDLHEVLLESLQRKEGSCFYLGSSEETLQKLRERLGREFPAVRMDTFSPPFRHLFTTEENHEMIDAINSFSPDVLFVGMTAPKQEKWVYANRHNIKAPLICCIGAVFDFYSGTVKRSGRLWIKLGLEWLPRLLREPLRLWRRNLVSTPIFIWYVISEKIRIKLSK